MTVPFEQRVFPAMQSGLPRKATLVGFCPSSNMTPTLVERLVLETEEAIAEPIRHTIRKLFPKKLDRSIADEVELAWKARKRVLMLSNQLSCPNHVLITANRFPRPQGGSYPADFGVFCIGINNAAPRALDLLTRLQTQAPTPPTAMGPSAAVRACQPSGASDALKTSISLKILLKYYLALYLSTCLTTLAGST